MKPMPIPHILELMTDADLKFLLEKSETVFLERLADVVGDILAERNALNMELADLLFDRLLGGEINAEDF